MIECWSTLFSTPVLVERYPRDQKNTEAEDRKAREIIESWRTRLSNISWFMRVLNKSIARQANREDRCKGRFWEGYNAAILACMAYVDLNPIRAGMAETPEDSNFTAIQERLCQFATAGQSEAPTSTAQPADLLPFVGGEHTDNPKGIAFTLPDYLQQDEWLEMVRHFGRRYCLAAGAVEQRQRFGERLGRCWLQGMGASRRFYQQLVPAR